MVKSILTIIFFSLLTGIYSQEESILREGLLRAQGTISFGKFNDVDQNGLYLHGTTEYYVKPTISARGDLFYYLKPNDESTIELNHQMFAGGSYHIPTNSNFNPYFGFQPGLAIVNFSDVVTQDLNGVNSRVEVSPLISLVSGFNYYANNWFHLFADARYIHGQYLSVLGATSISELRLSFGLGFNLNTK